MEKMDYKDLGVYVDSILRMFENGDYDLSNNPHKAALEQIIRAWHSTEEKKE